jgi:nicotinate-nucleotide pyrophosphorylase (carboxylating)
MNELEQVLEQGMIDRIMLDNFSIPETEKAVKLVNGRYEIESSGGITLETVRSYAKCGVDYISVGALTHHIKSMDISLKAI